MSLKLRICSHLRAGVYLLKVNNRNNKASCERKPSFSVAIILSVIWNMFLAAATTVEDMFDYVKPILKRKPDNVVFARGD